MNKIEFLELAKESLKISVTDCKGHCSAAHNSTGNH